jgi:hypothetical protein
MLCLGSKVISSIIGRAAEVVGKCHTRAAWYVLERDSQFAVETREQLPCKKKVSAKTVTERFNN